MTLSPEEISYLYESKSADQSRSSIFSLGMIILEAISLIHVKEFFNYDYSEILTLKIESVMESVSIRYSYRLRDLLKSMLESCPQKRPSVDVLIEMVHGRDDRKSVVRRDVVEESVKSKKEGKRESDMGVPTLQHLKATKQIKENIPVSKMLLDFPSPNRATVWINKGVSNSLENPRKIIKI